MENFTRAFTVSGNVITDSKPTKKAGNAGENIVTSLSFTFSSEWDDAIKSIVFKTPKNKLLTPQTITGSIAPIPQDALDSGGTLQFSLMGAFADSEQVLRTPTYGLDVESTLSILGGTPLATYTNVVLDCQTATQEAITAKDAAVLATERIETTGAAVQAAEGLRVIAETAREERADTDHSTAENDHTVIAPTISEVQTARGGKTSLGARLDAYDSKLSVSAYQYPITRQETTTVPVTFTSGYFWNGVGTPSASYYYTNKIAVQAGDIITSTYFNNPQALRYAVAYNGNTLDAAHSTSVEGTSYTVPAGVDGVIVTVYSAGIADKIIKKTATVADVAYAAKYEKKSFCFSASAVSLAANADLKACSNIDNKKNCSYLFSGFFSAFDILKIGHGKTEYGAVYLTIDATNIKTYSNTGALFQTFAHGLAIADFIMVNIKVADDYGARAVVTIDTNGGHSVTSNVIFFGCNGDVYANSTVAMTNCVLKYVVADMRHDVFVFGDSYMSLADNMKFPYYLLTGGYTKMLLSGFGGATAAQQLTALQAITAIQRPKYIVWLLGMNNPDTTVIEQSWKTCTDSIIALCAAHGITPILATIPNTPVMKNTLKNACVRASGCRYVDFAKAVNAEAEGATWYAGMLSADNVHPSETGAKALAARILLDVPELTI